MRESKSINYAAAAFWLSLAFLLGCFVTWVELNGSRGHAERGVEGWLLGLSQDRQLKTPSMLLDGKSPSHTDYWDVAGSRSKTVRFAKEVDRYTIYKGPPSQKVDKSWNDYWRRK